MSKIKTEKKFHCSNGHWLVPNGHGDLDLYCGDRKLNTGFIPYLTRFGLKGHCNICDKDVDYDDPD